MLICSGGDNLPEHDPRDISLVIRGCQWQLTRDEFRHVVDEIGSFADADADDVDRALREFRRDN